MWCCRRLTPGCCWRRSVSNVPNPGVPFQRMRPAGIADDIGYPVVLKLDSPNITYKSDVHGVRLDVGNERGTAVA